MPVRDSQGRIVGAVAVFRDITEIRTLAEEITNLKQIQSLLTAVINSTQDAISVVDHRGIGILINPAYTRLIGFSEEDVIGKPATVDIAEGESVHLEVLRTRKPVKNAKMKVGPMKRPVVVNGSPILVDGKLMGSVAVIRDVSEIMQLTEELERIRSMVKGFEAKYTFEDVVAESPLMVQAVEQAKQVASTPVTVLLRGESGTGKELFAHAIHNASPRRNRPFVRVNCAALPKTLLESELFGYVNGAFTGARKGGRKGLFEEADGGTLFLDEIGVMDLSVQASFLRVLQEREIMRIGDSKPTPIDVRVIAATNVPLEQLVAQGKFREDLYYRLNVIPIFIPPLRQRPEDLPKLCRFLLRKLNQDYGRAVKGVGDEVMRRFLAYKWPGNVRELENVLGRAIINMGFQDQVICSEHVPPLGWGGQAGQWVPRDISYPKEDDGETLRDAVARAEAEAIKRALERFSYNKTRAAKSLGISIRALYNKIHKYGLSRETS
jgi:PAS domain S-box-containing protein